MLNRKMVRAAKPEKSANDRKANKRRDYNFTEARAPNSLL
jgi:hypothetical protein